VNPRRLTRLLEEVRRGALSIEEAVERLQHVTFDDLGFAKIDHHRASRCGFPEVVLCEGKRIEDLRAIVENILASGSDLLATRATPEQADVIRACAPQAVYHERARTVSLKQRHGEKPPRPVFVVCAGTSDIPVAEEARITAEMMDNDVETLYDVGVAGLHRLLVRHADLLRAGVIVAVAGMEGALPSVVGGLVPCPVIAVPTSVGYGASFAGIAPLLTMLNCCAAGVAVVNIDNGFGGGYVAALINRTGMRREGDSVPPEAGPAAAGSA